MEMLTQKEKEVMNFLSLGESDAMIAEYMDLSINTVKTHLKHIYKKIGVSNRTSAVLKWMEQKEIQ